MTCKKGMIKAASSKSSLNAWHRRQKEKLSPFREVLSGEGAYIEGRRNLSSGLRRVLAMHKYTRSLRKSEYLLSLIDN